MRVVRNRIRTERLAIPTSSCAEIVSTPFVQSRRVAQLPATITVYVVPVRIVMLSGYGNVWLEGTIVIRGVRL